jgi:hypothetical protein
VPAPRLKTERDSWSLRSSEWFQKNAAKELWAEASWSLGEMSVWIGDFGGLDHELSDVGQERALAEIDLFERDGGEELGEDVVDVGGSFGIDAGSGESRGDAVGLGGLLGLSRVVLAKGLGLTDAGARRKQSARIARRLIDRGLASGGVEDARCEEDFFDGGVARPNDAELRSGPLVCWSGDIADNDLAEALSIAWRTSRGGWRLRLARDLKGSRRRYTGRSAPKFFEENRIRHFLRRDRRLRSLRAKKENDLTEKEKRRHRGRSEFRVKTDKCRDGPEILTATSEAEEDGGRLE